VRFFNEGEFTVKFSSMSVCVGLIEQTKDDNTRIVRKPTFSLCGRYITTEGSMQQVPTVLRMKADGSSQS
jgi:hypothetical protein